MFLKLPFIPTNYTISFALGIANREKKSNAKDFVKVDFINPSSQVIFSSGRIEIQDNIKIDGHFINLAGNLQNVQFDTIDIYKSNMYLNDKLLGSPEIEVNK